MRYMGLDVGDKTIGVAISDELGFSANPIKIIQRIGSLRKEIGEIRQLTEEYGVELIVVGMPFMMDGTVGVQAEKVIEFIEELKRRQRVPVDTWDERLSTAEVERMLIASDQSRSKRKQVVDMLAAAVILQGYMDRHRAVTPTTDNDTDYDNEE
ncbi:MAG: Holliday junction resolvase RuvX [Armatimonadota bacterium]